MSKKVLVVFATTLLFLAFSTSASATSLFHDEDVVTEDLIEGEVDWTNGLIRTSGSSGLDVEESSNISVSKLRRERTAKIDAMRKMLETIKALPVDSGLLVESYFMTSAFVRNGIHQAIRESSVVEKKYISDDEVEVIIETPIKGALIETLIQDTGRLKLKPRGSEVFTGLVIDARGLEISPALSPIITDTSGRELYGTSVAQKKHLVSMGLLSYMRDPDMAIKSDRVSGNPLVIKALSRSIYGGDSNIVISAEDAKTILSKTANYEFLEECRVIVIID